MFCAAVVLVTLSTGIPVVGFHATLLTLYPSAGLLFQLPWNVTYAASPLVLNLMSSGAVCAGKQSFGAMREQAALEAPLVIVPPTLI